MRSSQTTFLSLFGAGLATLSAALLAACAPDVAAPAGDLRALVVSATDAGSAPPRSELRTWVADNLSRAPHQLTRVERTDGVQQLRVQAGFQHATIAVVRADGVVEQRCIDDEHEARQLLDEVAR